MAGRGAGKGLVMSGGLPWGPKGPVRRQDVEEREKKAIHPRMETGKVTPAQLAWTGPADL